jgi:hypothetical protein
MFELVERRGKQSMLKIDWAPDELVSSIAFEYNIHLHMIGSKAFYSRVLINMFTLNNTRD